jgi:hypothetical protein
MHHVISHMLTRRKAKNKKREVESGDRSISYKHPLAAPLDELIQQQPHIREDEAADVEAEELGGVASR